MPNDGSTIDYIAQLRQVRRRIEVIAALDGTGQRAAGFLRRLERRLERPLRIAILGEPNSGKTTLANYLLGLDVLVTDSLANTRAPVLLRHSPAMLLEVVGSDGTRTAVNGRTSGALRLCPGDRMELALPLDLLRSFQVIDTPSQTQDCARTAQAIRTVCHGSDMAVWCTLASQAWRGSERAAWLEVGPRLRRSSVLAVTHLDLVDAGSRPRLEHRLRRETRDLFATLVMLPSMARHALEADGPDIDGPATAAAIETPGGDGLLGALQGIASGLQARRALHARQLVARFTARLGADSAPADSAPADSAPADSGPADARQAGGSEGSPTSRPYLRVVAGGAARRHLAS